MSERSHYDNRGVFIELWVLDILDDDYPAALLLSQLLWWHQPAKDGAPRARYERDGQLWLLRSDDEWHGECRLTVRQVRRIRTMLTKAGLVEGRRFKRNGAPVSAWRPLLDAIQAARQSICPDSEDPSGGDHLGADPHMAVGSDPGESVPRSSTSEVDQQTIEGPPPTTEPEWSEDVIAIVAALEAGVTHQQGHAPKTVAWFKPVDLLLRRGCTKWRDPVPVPASEVLEMIEVLFTRGAERSGDGFCWADVIQSGEKLRKQWAELLKWRARIGATTRSRPNRNLDAVDEALEFIEAAGRKPGQTLGVARPMVEEPF